ncbi:hypothetical protein [Streptomyces cinnamoneus]|uniref:Uncharacterized protein n=1 Tax=Streptomyces cinnamoneus TaxID=53446 RepID=A0A918WMN6_STRCJ|nr:hypothetical protein [Streptomyces cinnamoneus]GHC60121.1 hypothetical protein GCM10010507_41430 [Streptomyces cinnamoneus]
MDSVNDAGQQAPESGVDAGFDEDAVLLLMQWLAEQGAVVTISAGGSAVRPVREERWTFHVSGPVVVAEEGTIGQCVRNALPRLREAGMPVDEGMPESACMRGGGPEGTGMLVLDWLAEQGLSVFLKADGARTTPGWTLIVGGEPLTERQRADGPSAGRCLGRMLSRLRAEGVAVPV